MQTILYTPQDFDRLPHARYSCVPMGYPCLAIGIWVDNPNDSGQYEYEFLPFTILRENDEELIISLSKGDIV